MAIGAKTVDPAGALVAVGGSPVADTQVLEDIVDAVAALEASTATIGVPVVQTYNGATGADMVINSTTTTLVITPTGNFNLSGFTGGSAGREVNVIFVGAGFDVTLQNDTGSSTGNKLLLPGGLNWVFSTGRGFRMVYDGNTSHWQIVALATGQFPQIQNNGVLYQYGNANFSGNVGFYGTSAVAKPTGVAVDAAGIHAALVTLGLIAA